MQSNTGSRIALIVCAGLAALGAPRLARAQVTDAATCPTSIPSCTTTTHNCCTMSFTTGTASTTATSSSDGTIIIPLDRCHQPPVSNVYNPVDTTGISPEWCANATGVNSNAMDYAYGLAYRVMQYAAINGITLPIYWIVNPTKAASKVSAVTDYPSTSGGAASDVYWAKDVDFWVLANGSSPPNPGSALSAVGANKPVIKLVDNGTQVLIKDSTWSYSKNQFPVRSSAFLISGSDRATFNTFWQYRPAGRTGCGTISGANCYDFTSVYMYELDPNATLVWQDFTQAMSGGAFVKNTGTLPVGLRIDYPPPKIAAVGGTALSNWLSQANLNDYATNTGTCKTGTAFSPSDAVACQLAESDVQSGDLKTGGFTWTWWSTHTNGTAGDMTTLCKSAPFLTDFMTAISGSYTAGNVMFFDDGIETAEMCGAYNMLGRTTLASKLGVLLQNSSINETASKPLIIRYPANLMAQFGDEPLNFAAGTVTNWFGQDDSQSSATSGQNLYSSVFATSPVTIRRLMTVENVDDTGGPGGTNPLCSNRDDLNVNSPLSVSGCDAGIAPGTSGASIFVNPPGPGKYLNADYVDLFTYGRYKNNVNNGIVFYSPGNNIQQNPQQAQLRMVLSALVATPPLRVEQVNSDTEISRSAPIAATLSSTAVIVQGSYEYKYVTYYNTQYSVPRTPPQIYTHDDVNAFTFPGLQGHFRARKDTTITTTASAFGGSSSSDSLFDAATLLAAQTSGGSNAECGTAFSGSNCRTIFTTLGSGLTPGSNYYFTSAASSLLRNALLSTSSTITTTDQQTLVNRITAGHDSTGTLTTFVPQLGGIDRSTAAIIPASGVASPGYTRPTMMYVGATDGMLHAFCGTVDSAHGCSAIGNELWAYVPRVNLPNMKYNSARIDGSPHVLDVQGTTSSVWTCSGTATSCWKTILLFQTGTGDATTSANTYPTTPAVYAIDVTDPTSPKVMWEYTTPTTRGTNDFGIGLGVAAGDAKCDDGTKKNIAMVATNNGGTGSSGLYLTAIDIENGTPMWKWSYTYPTSPAIPTTGVPGGAVTADSTDAGTNGFMTDVLAAGLAGNLWMFKPVGSCPATGTTGTAVSRTTDTSTPWFKFTTNYHPIGGTPSIYSQTSGGTQYAIVAEGGYADTVGATGWGNNTSTHYALAVNISTTAITSGWPLLDTDTNGAHIPWKLTFGTGEKAYDQAMIIGNQAFIATDTASVNSATYGTQTSATGHVYVVNLGLATSSQYTNASAGFLQATAVTMFGASSVTNNGTVVIVSSGSKIETLGNSSTGTGGTAVAATATSGATVTGVTVATNQITHQLWLRTE